MDEKKILVLKEAHYINKGLHRRCYLHPNNDRLCVKILYNHNAEAIKSNRREINYYLHLSKRNITWSAVPRYYGALQTNYGDGHVFDLIRDYDDNIAKTLDAYLTDPYLTATYYEQLLFAFRTLKRTLLADRIITMALKSKNILFQRLAQHQARLVIIDNIGNPTFIPVASYFVGPARHKIERTWQRFIHLMQAETQHNPHAQRLLAELSQGIN